jgi:iron complex outermembrane receptor protein
MKLNKSLILASTAVASLFVTSHALAQSTASQEVEVVVKGTKKGAGPINKETGIKTRSVIDQDFISNQPSGQTVAQTLNVVPGYNFTNNDPYGSSGGNVRLRGLDGSRISLTQDGVQLNDAGNYAIYTNQQLDPELIASASVLTGGTDVDSMTASSTGGTINLVTRKPSDTFGIQTTLSAGSWSYSREFGMIDTGKFGPFGTSAWISYSNSNNNTFTLETPDNGKIHKRQLNFRVWQPVFDNGSYISLSGNYNKNLNRFVFSQNRATFASKGLYYNSAGPANINPSNTGNLKIQSKWVINEHLFLTFDPAYQSVLANGGGTSTANEATGKIGSWTNPQFKGVDLNGDGDALDTVTIYNPNTTATNRLSLQSAAVYTFTRGDTLRFNASFDRGRTKQSGDGTLVAADGTPLNPFGAKDADNLALKGKDGFRYERRYRFSLANVDVLSLEYRGRFLDDRLFLSIGVKDQKMERDLNQFCYSSTTGTGSTTPFCTTANPTSVNANGTVNFTGNTGSFFRPYHTTVSFSKTMPNFGATYNFTPTQQIYANYSEAMSSPRTDNYYAVTLSDTNTISVANPLPELAKTMEFGYRYNTSKITASADIWQSKYDNRIVSSYDADTDTFFDRNVGKVDFKGAEAAIAWAPTSHYTLYSNVSYTDTKVLNDVPNGKVKTALGTDTVGTILYIPLKGKQLVEVPKWMANLGGTYRPHPDFLFAWNAKYVGDRYSTDMNDDIAKGYLTIDGSARWNLPKLGPTKAGTYLQLNVINLTNRYYYGSISSATTVNTLKTASGTTIVSAGTPSFNVGAPRTVMLSLHAQF